jgi:alpha-tubulin suppressor-like RCC1 family protein
MLIREDKKVILRKKILSMRITEVLILGSLPRRIICSVLIIAITMSLMVGLVPENAYALEIKAQTISAGGSHTAAIKTDGSLWTWGRNEYGQLGDGTIFTDKNTPVKVMDQVAEVSVGTSHSAAIKTDGSLWTWGYNNDGQLGDGTKIDRNTPSKVMDQVVTVGVGGSTTAVIKTDRSLWTWGWNYSGQLGDGTRTNRAIPAKVMDNVTAVNTSITCMAAIKTDGSLWTWGLNKYGGLGDGTTIDRYSPVKIMDNVAEVSVGFHTAVIKTDGSLWTWGWNGYGQLGDGTTLDSSNPVKVMENVAAVSSSGYHTAVIKTDGSLWTWGYNEFGQLGDGTTTNKTKPVKIMENVAAVSANVYNTTIVKTDGSLWTWGSNGGKVKEGTWTESHIPIKILENVAVSQGSIPSDFYDLTVNNLVKNKAFSIFINPVSEDGYKVWEFNYKDDLNMTEKEYKNYVYLSSVGAALVEVGVDLSDYDFIDMFGNNNQREYLKDAITSLLIPTEEETKTIIQKKLESLAENQEYSNNRISITNDLVDIYKELKGNDFNYVKFCEDVGGEVTDKGLSIGLSAVNDTITELITLKTIADTYDIIGENYEEFINNLSAGNITTQDKDLIVELSKEIIEKNKKNTKDQIISATLKALADNTFKESMKLLITNIVSSGPEKISSLAASIALTLIKIGVSGHIEAANSWLAFAGMNSIQKLAAKEYEILLDQAQNEKMTIPTTLQSNLKNAALVYTMSSIKCRDLLLTTVEKTQIIPNEAKIEPLKYQLGIRNDLAYKVFETWKNARIENGSGVINFQDANLEAAVRETIKKPSGEITDADVKVITSLNAYNKNISNLEGIQYFSGLEELELSSNQISNISVLSGLTSLKHLYLGNNQIRDISPLSGLTSLKELFLQANQISNISALRGLTGLEVLYLFGNKISDISVLRGLTGLKELSLAGNNISDYSPVADYYLSHRDKDFLDTNAPNAPIVNFVDDNDKSVTGKTETLATIYVKKGSTVVGTSKVNTNGIFTVTIPVQKAGTTLSVTSKDFAGNVSKATTVIVKDKTPPAMPTVNTIRSSTKSVTGGAEAGSLVVVKRGSNILKSAYAKSNGSFTLTIPAQKKGTVLYLTAKDKAGNTSAAREVVVAK